MREAGSPWKVSVAVDPKLIGATNVRLIANKIAGEPTPATYDFKAAAIPQALLAAQPGARGVAGENYPWLGPDRRPLSRRGSRRSKRTNKKSSRVAVGGGLVPHPGPLRREGKTMPPGERDPLCQHYLPPNTAAICG